MAFEGLNAQISAEALDYNTTIERAKDRTEQLADESDRVSLSMQVMQGRVDEAAEENRDLAASSVLASGGLTALATSGHRTSLSMTTLSVALTGSVVPAIAVTAAAVITLGAVLASAAAAVLSLVGTFGLLLGAGVVTHLEDLQQAFQDVVPRIKDALRPLGQVFGPLLEQAIRALPELVRRIVDAVGGVQQFRTALEDLGAFAMEAIPALVGIMANFARAVLPALRRVVSYIQGDGSKVFSQLQQTFLRISDELGAFIGAVVKALPPLIKLGGILAEGFLPPLTMAINILTFLVRGLNGLIMIGEALVAFLKGVFSGAIGVALELFSQLATSLKIVADLVIRLYNLFTKLANVIPGINLPQAPTLGSGGIGAGAGGSAAAGTRRSRSDLRASTRRRRGLEGNDRAPIEVQVTGDTGVVEDVAARRADERIDNERRRVRRSGNSTRR